MRRPVNSPYTISTEFGEKDSNALFGYHSGVDYAVPSGREVYAPVAGTVTYASYHNVRGNMVGIFDGQFTHRLMHNSQFRVKVGDKVTEGQLVALSGTTGLSTGPHVHWDIINRNTMDATAFGDFIDPFEWLNGKYIAPLPPSQPTPVQDVLQPWQRRTTPYGNGVNRREAPSVNAKLLEEFIQPNDVFDFKGYVVGEAYSGNNIWFVGRYGTPTYFWSGAFTDPGTSGLPNLTDELFPKKPEPTPVEQPYSFTKDLDVVTEVIPANNKNFQKGNFPTTPSKVVIHDFGTDGKDTVTSTVNWFQNPASETSAHFVVSGKRIIQMVSLSDRAWHAGSNGNAYIGIETDPKQDPDTIESVNKLLNAIEAKYGYRPTPIKHSEIMKTACGDDVDLANYEKKEPLPVETPPAPVPTPDNNPVRPKVKAAGIAGLLLTVALGVLNVLYPGNTPTEVDVAPAVAAVTTLVAFGAAYFKRDGLSPK